MATRDDDRDPLERAADEVDEKGSVPEERRTAVTAGQGVEVEDSRVADETPAQSRRPRDGGEEA